MLTRHGDSNLSKVQCAHTPIHACIIDHASWMLGAASQLLAWRHILATCHARTSHRPEAQGSRLTVVASAASATFSAAVAVGAGATGMGAALVAFASSALPAFTWRACVRLGTRWLSRALVR